MEKGSSSSSSSGGDGSDSINGLKFGKKIYFAGAVSGLRPVAAPSTPRAKKGRTGTLPARCQVEGCTADLSDAKAYYYRHKVCGVHSKSPSVIVAGIEQRFCQQCSRFHQLPEFDQGKRSCRRRLAGHNERRRKPPPGPLLPFRYGTLSPSTYDNHSREGGLLMDFSSYSSSTNGRDSWPNIGSQRGPENQSAIPQTHDLSWPRSSHDHPLPNLLQKPNPHPEISPNGCFNGILNSNDGALSLLSNTSWGPMAQPKASGLGPDDFLRPMNPSSSIGQFPCGPWGFKGNQGGGLLHEMAPDMVGLAAFSQGSNSQFSGGLGLAQSSDEHFHNEIEQSGGHDATVHHMQRSL